MEKDEQPNPWFESRLDRRFYVNKAWRAVFMKSSTWKSWLQREWPFVDLSNTSDYFQKFKDTLASLRRLACEHQDADVSTAIRVCECAYPTSLMQHVVHYTGHKNEYVLRLESCLCNELIPTKEYLHKFPLICDACHKDIESNVDICAWEGAPESKTKWSNATWIHKEFNLDDEIVAAIAIPNSNNLVAITKNNPMGKLVLIKFTDDEIDTEELLPTCSGDSLRISNSGRFVAGYHVNGGQGFVYDLDEHRTTFTFDRLPIRMLESQFPVAFFTYENKEYLIAGKSWNRVDLYEPESGTSLRERELDDNDPGRHEFYWCALHVSPDQKNLCSYGWMWHPVGKLNVYSIEDWMTGKLYAMEDSKTIHESVDWNHPVCWLDNNTIVAWGDSRLNWTNHGTPVIQSHSIRTNPNSENNAEPSLKVPLARYPLVFDEYLISLNPNGVELVDVNDGHVLFIHNQRAVQQVLCYNKHSKQVVSIKKNESKVLVLSNVVYYDKK